MDLKELDHFKVMGEMTEKNNSALLNFHDEIIDISGLK